LRSSGLTLCGSAAVFFEEEDSRRTRTHGYQIANIPSLSQSMPSAPELGVDLITWIQKLTNEPSPLPVTVRRSGQQLYLKMSVRFESEYPARARALMVATQTALARYYPSAMRIVTEYPFDNSRSQYLRAQFESEPAPWDNEPASVWIGTFKRAATSDIRLPPKEILELTDEQESWLADASGFRDVGLLSINVRGGLVHAALPKSVFFRDQKRAWLLMYAVQQMLSTTWKDRDFRDRGVSSSELGLTVDDLKMIHARIDSLPPPANR